MADKRTTEDVKEWMIAQADRLAGGRRYAFCVAFGEDDTTKAMICIAVEGETGAILLSDAEGNALQPPSHELARQMTIKLNVRLPWRADLGKIAEAAGMLKPN